MKAVSSAVDGIENKPFGHYALTKYFLLYLISVILERDEKGKAIIGDPGSACSDKKDLQGYVAAIGELLKGLIVDLNYEAKDIANSTGSFDYKDILKSPQKVIELGDSLLRQFEKDVARGKARPFGDLWNMPKAGQKKAK